MKIDFCYWCEAEATSREHVPPKNLFPKDKRSNLLTVPACQKHNESCKKLDERMRFFMQAGSATAIALQWFDATTMRSLEDEKAQGLTKGIFNGIKPYSLPEGMSAELRFDPKDYKQFFEKITRGIHFSHYRTPFLGEFRSGFRQPFAPAHGMPELFKALLPHFERMGVKGKAPHPDIFDYKFISSTVSESRIFCVIMRFYEGFEAIGILISKALISHQDAASLLPPLGDDRT